MATDDEQTIRPARVSDAEPIAGLLGELGYPAAAPEVSRRLGRLLARDDGGVVVAEVRREVVGVAAYQIVPMLERAQPQCRLTTLVTRVDHRRRGVAARLVASVEAAARAADCFRLEVTTRPSRRDAFAFYAAAGFAERRRRLVKPLAT